jgi:hypothetical protein
MIFQKTGGPYSEFVKTIVTPLYIAPETPREFLFFLFFFFCFFFFDGATV